MESTRPACPRARRSWWERAGTRTACACRASRACLCRRRCTARSVRLRTQTCTTPANACRALSTSRTRRPSAPTSVCVSATPATPAPTAARAWRTPQAPSRRSPAPMRARTAVSTSTPTRPPQSASSATRTRLRCLAAPSSTTVRPGLLPGGIRARLLPVGGPVQHVPRGQLQEHHCELALLVLHGQHVRVGARRHGVHVLPRVLAVQHSQPLLGWSPLPVHRGVHAD
jgi:hypothetical protein